MYCDEIIEEIIEVLDSGFSLPVKNGKAFVDIDKLFMLVENLKAELPPEFNRAKKIVASHDEYVADAEKKGDEIIRNATIEAQKLVDNDAIVVRANDKATKIVQNANEQSTKIINNAQLHANDIIKNAKINSNEIKQASVDFVSSVMDNAAVALQQNLKIIKDKKKSFDEVK